ncbi:MAG TPA: XRE family transcriptional regulator [Acetobacteraceae bacterium]|nr:XRE family transcriptional regulator [Acetobacteraceae bacterium]
MTNQRFASVWDAIENTPAEAENMKLRAALMMILKGLIERRKMSQAVAAEFFGVTQPRISDLVRGKIGLFSLDMLVNMLAAAGLHVSLKVEKRARAKLPAHASIPHQQHTPASQ